LKRPKNRKLLQADALAYLPHTETTLAKHLQSAGISPLSSQVASRRCGILPGDARLRCETSAATHWGAPETFFWPYSGKGYYGDEFRYIPHLEFGSRRVLTDRLTDEAMRVIDHANGKPFFLYLAHHAVHTPMEAKADDVKHFQEKVAPA